MCAAHWSKQSVSSKREQFDVGTVVIVETGADAWNAILSREQYVCCENGGHRTTVGCRRQLLQKKHK